MLNSRLTRRTGICHHTTINAICQTCQYQLQSKHMAEIQIYNTLTRTKEPIKPENGKPLGLYTCGPTVYGYAHIGNLRTFVFEDILKRTLLYNDMQVKHVMNITDVGHLTDDADLGEDKMEKAAKESDKSAWELAEMYTESFLQDMKYLNNLEPDVLCKATDHIEEQIKTIIKIQENGYTYTTSDGLYFDTSKLDDYGKLARLDIEGLEAGKRIDMGEKKHVTDFALWKFSPKNEKRQMEWDSPWGVGFPGWHIECSAMATKYLGVPFDIHCGGIDLVPVHHTNEIAQTKAAEGKELARIWVHGEFLNVKDGKMAKSQGNALNMYTLREKGYDPLAYRYYLLQAHYRQVLEFSWGALDAAQTALNKLYLAVSALPKPCVIKDHEHLDAFKKAINDDLQIPKVVALLWELLKSDIEPTVKAALVYEFDAVLGLNIKTRVEQIKEVSQNIPTNIAKLLEERANARIEKKWDTADQLREEIIKAGYWLEDTQEGTKLIPKL